MAGTLGTVASIIQLVDTALKAKDYIQDFVHAPHEQKKLLSEMDDLHPLLEELRNRIVGNPSSAILQRMDTPLADFKVIMEQFTDKLRPGTKFSKRLTWTMWSKKEAEEYLRKFEQFKSLISSWDTSQYHGAVLRTVSDAVNTVNSGVTSINDGISEQRQQITAVNEAVENVANVVDVVSSGVTRICDDQNRQMDDAERTKVLDWLSPINFFLRHADIAKARQAETGGWLLEEPRFQYWKSGSGKTLWCRGIPGAGKTVLAYVSETLATGASTDYSALRSLVVDHLRSQSKSKDIGVACMYLNHREAHDQTPGKLLAALWRQLIVNRDIGYLARNLYQRHREPRTMLPLEDVVDVLHSSFEGLSKVYIIVDAVDEYPEDERLILLRRLAALGPTVNLMITSRPHITPFASLPNLDALEIRANECDVRRYVDAKIDSSFRLLRHVQARPELREEINTKIGRTVDGMFLLAKLHVESLRTKSTIKAVREALKDLPKDLRDSYDDAMKRIQTQSEEDKNIAQSTLIWVVNAKRPLKVIELQVALAIEPDTRQLDSDNILDIEMILAVCAGLVIVDEHLDVVRLVHYTTQEYLDSVQPHQFPDAQTEITRTLLTYLAFEGFPPQSLTGQYAPLVDYSQYCLVHAAGKPEIPLRKMLLEFFPRAFEWRRIRVGIWRQPPWNFIHWPAQPSALWIAAAANLLETAKFLLQDVQILKQSDSPEISVASYCGHLRMVQLLLENGADVNAGGPFGSALQSAVYSENAAMVQLLLATGADANKPYGEYGPPLATASFLGYRAIVQLLLDNGADANAQGGKYGCALQLLSMSKCGEDIVHHIALLLIKKGANVNATGGLFGSPLHAAILNSSALMVQLLIDNGADINMQAQNHGTPLSAASYYGHENLVQLLINYGADPNALGGDHRTPLAAASWAGHENIVRLLLKNGANDNGRGGHVNFALQAAVFRNQAIIARLLIDNGADPNLEVKWDGAALAAASSLGHTRLAQLLINSDTLNASGTEWTALRAASWFGHENIVRLLLEKGAHTGVGPWIIITPATPRPGSSPKVSSPCSPPPAPTRSRDEMV